MKPSKGNRQKDQFPNPPLAESQMKKCSKSHHHALAELNITPLLDLAFVLLVIFIITTTPIVNDLDVDLPSADRSAAGRRCARLRLWRWRRRWLFGGAEAIEAAARAAGER